MATRQSLPRRPHFENEATLSARGFIAIAGLDEVGRGTLAGPVVAGAAVLPGGQPGQWARLINDSKQMSPEQRVQAYGLLTEVCLTYGTGACDAADIDRIGIVAATKLAMARALEMLDPAPDCLLIDALDLPAVGLPQLSVIKGDAISLSIAAASIIAKVTRDRLMETVFEERFPGYGFAEHKGYGTAEHMAALYRLGPSEAHRLSFAPVRDALEARQSARRPAPAPVNEGVKSDDEAASCARAQER
jgi:ribonuclease HII